MSGFTVKTLRAKRIACPKARNLMRSAVYFGAPKGYRCHANFGPGVVIIKTKCKKKTDPGHWFSGSYRRD